MRASWNEESCKVKVTTELLFASFDMESLLIPSVKMCCGNDAVGKGSSNPMEEYHNFNPWEKLVFTACREFLLGFHLSRNLSWSRSAECDGWTASLLFPSNQQIVYSEEKTHHVEKYAMGSLNLGWLGWWWILYYINYNRISVWCTWVTEWNKAGKFASLSCSSLRCKSLKNKPHLLRHVLPCGWYQTDITPAQIDFLHISRFVHTQT